MTWKKKGLIFAPDGSKQWARGYAHMPTAEIIDNRFIRVYFSGLDKYNYGRISYVDLDIDNPKNVLYIHDTPILDIGENGTFDDCGVVPSSVININNKKYLYYVGFQRTEKVPYMLFSGLAIESEGEFEKYSKTPILDRTSEEPFSRSAPYILYNEGIYKMWYWSCINWSIENKGIHYNNVIRYAESSDGIYWVINNNICIEPNWNDEYSVGRPCVIYEDKLYKMWYSIRSKSKGYFIGYAESVDGIQWIRRDNCVGIEVSDEGWDSQIICYPNVLTINGVKHMFYNGNQHGKTGFGYAVLEE